MSVLTVDAHPEATAYLQRIADEMVTIFGMSRNEAIGRINRRWSGRSIRNPNDVMMLLHRDLDWWAKTVVYGIDSEWWRDEANATPLPFPDDN